MPAVYNGAMNELTLPPVVLDILHTLNAAGRKAFIVGGCVRDSLMGIVPHDFDIATDATPQEVKTVFAGRRFIDSGIRYGTVTLLVDGQPYEITTFRSDGGYSEHRHPDTVTYGRSIEEDLKRRDFTINAMAYHPDAGLIDPYGGQNDLEAGLIRAVGDPRRRFEEDALRLLRGLRFAARFGFTIEEQTDRALREKKELLRFVSGERIRREFDEILCAPKAGEWLGRYREVIAVFLPEIVPMFGFDQHNRYHVYDLWTHTLICLDQSPAKPAVRWAALFHDRGKVDTLYLDPQGSAHFYGHQKVSDRYARQALTRLHCDHQTMEQVSLLVLHHDNNLTVTRYLKRDLAIMDWPTFQDLVALMKADNYAKNPALRHPDGYYQEILDHAQAILQAGEPLHVSDLAVDGNDLTALGFAGKEIGEALNDCLEQVYEYRLPNEKAALLNYLEEKKENAR